MNKKLLKEWIKRSNKAKSEAHKILAKHDRSISSRVVLLDDVLSKLNNLPVDVQDYFRESVICLENELTRAAIVLSWSGFFHVVAEKLMTDHESALRKQRQKWTFSDLAELKANYTEFAILEAAKVVGLIKNAKLREYQGMLSKRNQCAHPTLYKPSLNTAIGYVDDILRKSTDYI